MPPAPSDSIALLATRTGHCREAAQLLGALEAWAQLLGISRNSYELMTLQLTEQAIESAIGPEQLAEQRALGAMLQTEDVYALSLAIVSAPQGDQRGTGHSEE